MAAHEFWRFSIASFQSGAGVVTAVQFYNSAGTLISTSGATFSASSNSSSAYQAFGPMDQVHSPVWSPASAPSGGSPALLQVQFASAVDVYAFTMSGSWQTNGPTNMSIEHSDDGSAWTTDFTYQPHFQQWEQFTFYTGGVQYGVFVTATTAGSTAVGIGGLKFYDETGTQVNTFGSSDTGFNSYDDAGIDNGSGTIWVHANGTPLSNDAAGSTAIWNSILGSCAHNYWTSSNSVSSGSPVAFIWHFPTVVNIGSVSLDGSTGINSPAAFELRKSTDGVAWTTVRSYAPTWGSSCGSQNFTAVTNLAWIEEGNVECYQFRRSDRTGNGPQVMVWNTSAPLGPTDTGSPGQVAYDSSGNLYICFDTNQWCRIGSCGYSTSF